LGGSGGERCAQLVGQLYGCLGLPQAMADEQVEKTLVVGAQQLGPLVDRRGAPELFAVGRKR
jgi:hypothetical protein